MSSRRTPLPVIPPPHVASNIELSSGYTIMKQLEASELTKPNAEQKERLMYFRILAYLISDGPTLKARAAVARRIVNCANEDEIFNEGKKFFDHYIRAFYRYRGPAPMPSIHSSRSYEDLQDMIEKVLVKAPKNHSEARSNALLRHEFRCPVTGWYDYGIMEINQWQDRVGATAVVTTECAHIIPESTNANITDKPSSKDQASHVWTILTLFGCQDIVDKLNGKGMYSLENILILQHDVHDRFDRLTLWFEPTSTPNVYNVCGAYTIPEAWNLQIKFTGSQDLPAPSAEYLALHAACCRVAHMSGAAEYIEQVYREFESVSVLSSDGNSAPLLAYALAPFAHKIDVH